MPLPTYAEIVPYLKKKLLSEQSHPANPALRIIGYTQVCQHEGAWDDVTRQCRGLVMNVDTGEVLVNPMPKAFNYQEHIQKGWPIPTEVPIITTKYDGSLGLLLHVDGQAQIATRGSFASEQAKWATAWWHDNVPVLADTSNAISHFFEIVYAANRIVVRYDFEGLVYLGSRVTATGEHVDCWPLFEGTGVRRVETVSWTDFESLAALDRENEEGFVAFFPKANVRVKVKMANYVRLHKILTGLSEIGIWEHLRERKTLDLEDIPDEFMAWVDEVQARLTAKYDEIEQQAKEDYARLHDAAADRKSNAIRFQTAQNPQLLFSMLDGRDYSDAIWRMVRPFGARQFTTEPDA